MSKPDFWEWQFHITRKWQPPEGVNKWRIVGFAVSLASYGPKGGNIYASAERVAKDGAVNRSTAKRLRRLCIKLGLFRYVQPARYEHGVQVIEIAIPPGVPTVPETVSTPAASSDPPAATTPDDDEATPDEEDGEEWWPDLEPDLDRFSSVSKPKQGPSARERLGM